MRRLCFLGLLALILSCEESNPTIYRVDDELLPYLETFLAEGRSRGFDFAAENLIMEFGTTTEKICGQFIHYKNNGQRKVIIVRSSFCWVDAPDQNREAIVFHELGHSLLDRDHRDDKFPNGAVASIMYSNIEGPYSPCIYDIDNDNSCNKTARRSYYIDELFDPSAPVPDWGE